MKYRLKEIDVDQDADRMFAALKAESIDAAYRKDLLNKVSELWTKDTQFRSAIRALVKHSEIKDPRGKRSRTDTKFVESMLKLGGKLGFSKGEILALFAQGIEPESIVQSLLRKRKKNSQST